MSKKTGPIVLILGSAPNAVGARDFPRSSFNHIVAINNAWRVRPDWSHLIHPDDFPGDRLPTTTKEDQRVVTSAEYVPLQNGFGGFVYAGGTMAFTAGYWALTALRPSVIAFLGCDMVYPELGQTHFYGTGTADPLRKDITLRNLEAKSARLMLLAARQGCACCNLSRRKNRLVFPRQNAMTLGEGISPIETSSEMMQAALGEEDRLKYFVPSGRYWEAELDIDLQRIDALDSL